VIFMSFSLGDKQIIVNYHYVEDPGANNSGTHPCSLAKFDRQIKFLANHFRFCSVPEVFVAAQNQNTEPLCAITFDDGLKDQYIHAVPVLKKYQATATFFIITGTFAGWVPVAHKMHVFLSLNSGEKLVDLANDFFGKKYFIPKDRRLTDKRQWDDVCTANLKETMIILPEDVKNQFLDRLLKDLNYDELELASRIFMNEDEVSRLLGEGFHVGSHTHRHEPLDTLSSRVEIEETVEQSKNYLANLVGVTPTLFCYPSGRFNKATVEVLNAQGFTHAVTIEQRAVVSEDHPLLIPRYDRVKFNFRTC